MYEDCRMDGFDYCVTRLPSLKDPTARQDILTLPEKIWRHSIVGELPDDDADDDDGKVPGLNDEEAQQNMKWQSALEWALHMAIPAVILPPLPAKASDADGIVAYARRVEWAASLCRSSGCKLWVPITPLNELTLQNWRLVMQVARYPGNVGMLVQLDNFTPVPSSSTTSGGSSSVSTSSSSSSAWLTRQLHLLHLAIGSGTISAIKFGAQQFLTNKKGYPTLSKTHQSLVIYLLCRVGRGIRVLMQGDTAHDRLPKLSTDARGVTNFLPYLQYLHHIRQRPSIRQALDTHVARMERDYLDGLQQPLQPLKDHLENSTYEVFERDPVKYYEYGRAIGMALQDRATHSNIVLMVVGAGRGPLVTAALKAYSQLPPNKRPPGFEVWAIEKNPSAARRLYTMSLYDPSWQHVNILQADLRNLSMEKIGGRPADIIVSELLGSLGCNELSPECLDGLWSTNAVHPGTVSIPTSYTSHVAPVASIKLWQQARAQSFYPNSVGTDVLGITKAMETPYVVRPHEASQMMKAQDCWEFTHPCPAVPPGSGVANFSSPDQHWNNRRAVLEFRPDPKIGIGQGCGYGPIDVEVNRSDGGSAASTSSFPWKMTGLLGTFTTLLYQRANSTENTPDDRVYLSTCPDQFSEGMFSWFPLYMPLEQPVSVPPDASVRVHLWRKVDPTNGVWYEWAVGIWHGKGQCLTMTPLHNPGGRSSKVSL